MGGIGNRSLKRQVEIVLDSNPGLEAYGILLPAGVQIILPDIDSTVSTPIIKTIQLWD